MITITIKTGNAAFEDGEGYEVARILRELAERIEDQPNLHNTYIPLMDYNGNKVGEMEG
jgi:hypothetical protein